MINHKKHKTQAVFLKISLLFIFIAIFISSSISVFASVNSDNFEDTVSKEKALIAISNSEELLQGLIRDDMPYSYVNDTIDSAKKAFQRAEYANLLNNKSLSGEVIDVAREALAGLNYEGFSYADVIKETNKVTDLTERIYRVRDSIRSIELKLDSLEFKIEDSDILSMITKAKDSFESERFDDAESFLLEADTIFSQRISEHTTLKAFFSNANNLLKVFWTSLIIILLVIIFGWLFFKRQINVYMLKRKYKKMLVEEKVLVKLMKKAQIDRFHKASIPNYLYEIKMKKYNERLADIKAKLPILKRSIEHGKK